jgi:acyl-[acyl-carrier-protein]-phospholipid O-acyltransferase/long-chain-fatty-acid--[acyl-carrier-protein] ligase
MADSTGRTLTYGRALVGSLLLSRLIRRHAPLDTHIGLLLPSSAGGALANIAVSLTGKVPVNINFTAGRDAMDAAVERCGITTVLSSRAFLAKAGLEPMAGTLFLEDLLAEATSAARLITLMLAWLLPASVLERRYVSGTDGDALATIIFSSGSTGVPKGVMLTHRNILSNIEAAAQVFQFTSTDVILGVLPFFHSFGFTGTLWLPLVLGFGITYHPNPMDAKTIGELAERHRATILISTPTFCLSYVRKCQPHQFASLRYAIVGAEKLREPVAVAFKKRFGIDLIEGYGCTEMAPVVAANVADPQTGKTVEAARGSVGRPLPGIRAMVIDVVSGQGPLVGAEGLLLVDGPNKMIGYVGEPDLTRQAFRDGWYVTGDIATIDEHGFIRITDRLSRFSKIAGEMVPHMKIEEQLQSLLQEPHSAVVTAVSDAARGERLVAFYTDPTVTPAEIAERLARSGMPRLWVPKREDLHFVEAIPTLGSGKIDLRSVRQLAMTRSDVPEGV